MKRLRITMILLAIIATLIVITFTAYKAVAAEETIEIAASADDGHADDGTWTSGGFSCGQYNIGFFNADDYDCGFRFLNVAVGQGAVINSATLTINITSITGSPDVDFYGNDADDASAWTTETPNGMTKTTAVTNFVPGSTGIKNIDVTDQIQEIIDRAGWVSGNDMKFAGFTTLLGGAGDAWFDWSTYEGGTNIASLTINHSPSGTDSSGAEIEMRAGIIKMKAGNIQIK